jgi:hypothetical protein
MMVVDSKKDRVLTQKEILEVVGANMGFGHYDKDAIINEFLTQFDVVDDVVQIGNTIFLYTLSKNKANGQVFNADTGRNFIANCITYFRRLQKRGVKDFSALADCSISKCLSIFNRLLSGTDSTLLVFKNADMNFMKLLVGSDRIRGSHEF